ncbi:hypothetical protein [Helicobacter pylori]|uniref:hypothetical protein n=1 Tax=Helicobacter pylori TaxID=210 RepID=UPI0004A49307|nr:hypothetical protein [Helicobacter pylori]
MKSIYLGVEKSIKDLQNIFKNADDKDEKLKRFNQEALEVFQQLELKSLKELESLKNNGEWENFTIAFYGETGAGKSTLIECLRMFFKERSKKHFRRALQGSSTVSAQVAFYGLSQALIPGTDFDKKKQKFLEIFKVEELLLYQSHFKPLVEFIAEELLKNSHAKIIQSNCNKALKVVEELQKAIKTTIEKQIDPGIKETQEHQQEARFNLDRSKEKFISDLENSAARKINQFESDFRIEMHERIERDIGNNECKRIFDNELKQRGTKLIEDIERRFKECEEQFRGSVGKNIEQLEERVKDSLAMLERIGINNLNPNSNFNMDSGIDTMGLFASIGGLVLLLLTPVVGEFALIAGVGLALVGVVKASWNVFNPDYKKSQQRKEVDKNLDKACEKIAESVKSRIESYKKGALGMIEELNAGFNKLVDRCERLKRQLKEAHEKLGYISNSIHLTISKQGACNEE